MKHSEGGPCPGFVSTAAFIVPEGVFSHGAGPGSDISDKAEVRRGEMSNQSKANNDWEGQQESCYRQGQSTLLYTVGSLYLSTIVPILANVTSVAQQYLI